MRFLLLNQTFYPDVVSSGQHLTDFALALAGRGHDVTVVVGERAYDNPAKVFPKHEVWNGIEIHRIRSTGFGKSAKWKRALDFGTFLLSCIGRILWLPRPDVVVAMTSPPLISFIAAVFAKARRCRFVYWVMDLNPDEAVAAGWLKPSSPITWFLDRLSRFSFEHADKIIALDRFMAERIVAKGISADKIPVIAPWSHDDVIRFDPAGRQRFRAQHGLDGKFVVMYSGNHSPCHPLTTLLEAARLLASDSRYTFLFAGGGSEFAKVQQFAERYQLPNVRCLPYQPLDQLSASLSAADMHVVVMGDPFVGMIHPCKIYNIFAVGAPILYIGPERSHINDIFTRIPSSRECYSARHGDAAQVLAHLRSAAEQTRRGEPSLYNSICAQFAKETLLPRQVAEVEALCAGNNDRVGVKP